MPLLLERSIAAIVLAAFLGGCAATTGGAAPAESPPVASDPVVALPPSVPVASGHPAEPASLIRVPGVYFNHGGSDIDRDGMALLQQCAERLKSDGRQRVTLVAMADDLGSRAFNVALADRRITRVQLALRRMGVAAHQIKRRNLGGDSGQQRCADESCRKLMRRVELHCAD